MPEEEYRSALGLAIAILKSGKRLPLHVAAELMREGYDVPALERRHFRSA